MILETVTLVNRLFRERDETHLRNKPRMEELFQTICEKIKDDQAKAHNINNRLSEGSPWAQTYSIMIEMSDWFDESYHYVPTTSLGIQRLHANEVAEFLSLCKEIDDYDDQYIPLVHQLRDYAMDNEDQARIIHDEIVTQKHYFSYILRAFRTVRSVNNRPGATSLQYANAVTWMIELGVTEPEFVFHFARKITNERVRNIILEKCSKKSSKYDYYMNSDLYEHNTLGVGDVKEVFLEVEALKGDAAYPHANLFSDGHYDEPSEIVWFVDGDMITNEPVLKKVLTEYINGDPHTVETFECDGSV